ncbi:MAG: cellulase family glycosylhydrolase, partial [Anaerolineae bacterium]|nr:cellulase family glycosylhydrolase [Anaerolineae bacterium]
ISVSPNGRYFVDEAGQGFIVLGQNDSYYWPGLSALYSGMPEGTENYVRDLRAHGITVSRVMIEYAQEASTYLENPVGTFSDSVVAFWDAFIAMAEEHGLYLLLTPYDTFWQNENWAGYPYNAEAGGPCASKSDWLTGRACIDAQKDRWRFIIDHWGDTHIIFAWDLMNEIDLYWNATPDEIDAYITEMAAFVRDYETEKWGRSRLITVSTSGANPVPEGQLGRVIFDHPALDFATTHLYLGPDIRQPENPIGAGPMMAGGVLRSLQEIEDNRPYFDSETGPIDRWIVSSAFDQVYHRNMSWGHLSACGAGSGMRWPYTNPHWILPEMRENLLALARFAATLDWANFASRNVSQEVRASARTVIDSACSDGQTAVLWLLVDTRRDESASLEGVTVEITGVLDDGLYTVEFWETAEGTIVTTMEVGVEDGVMQIALPDETAGLPDVALIIRHKGQ